MSSDHGLTPVELCDAAMSFMRTADAETASLWPRAAAILARQGLEVTLDFLWAARAPGCEAAPMRAQLAVLPEHLGDPALAGRVSYAWWSLTMACHYHPYDLPPTAGELALAVSTVRELVDAVAARVSPSHPRSGAGAVPADPGGRTAPAG